jgi:hypothetical protein
VEEVGTPKSNVALIDESKDLTHEFETIPRKTASHSSDEKLVPVNEISVVEERATEETVGCEAIPYV